MAEWSIEFPSPHGDKFQLEYLEVINKYWKFPSPHGDKFQRRRNVKARGWRLFPSPHGDKFQHGFLTDVFPPLVSVPSRG